mgnify:CR=1 FL=1
MQKSPFILFTVIVIKRTWSSAPIVLRSRHKDKTRQLQKLNPYSLCWWTTRCAAECRLYTSGASHRAAEIGRAWHLPRKGESKRQRGECRLTDRDTICSPHIHRTTVRTSTTDRTRTSGRIDFQNSYVTLIRNKSFQRTGMWGGWPLFYYKNEFTSFHFLFWCIPRVLCQHF